MNFNQFVETIRHFADDDSELLIEQGKIILQAQGRFLEASLEDDEGTVWVREPDSQRISAYAWIRDRVARLETLSGRISEKCKKQKDFIKPTGIYSPAFSSELEESQTSDAEHTLVEELSQQITGVSKFVYLISDAGEGKTTLIDQIAVDRAHDYRGGKKSWILVPIRLGGRPFMSLDDIVAAELVNRWRFPLFYDAFLQLVKLRMIVPALDGFEEVLVESSSRDGITALGELANNLDGMGNVLIAARKAYFEVHDIGTQSRFFDSLSPNTAVELAKLQLQRWGEFKFVEYCEKRHVVNPGGLYQRLCERLGSEHPLLTRAVLVRRVVDLASDDSIDNLVSRLGNDPSDYFTDFVYQLVEREATQKWIDRVGEDQPSRQLLSVDEHIDLLKLLAQEMWLNKSSVLKKEFVDLVADLFLEERNKSPQISLQVKEKLINHSLLKSALDQKSIQFDHEDFQDFFLGQVLTGVLKQNNPQTIDNFLRINNLPNSAIESSVTASFGSKAEFLSTIKTLSILGSNAPDTSYVKENAARLLVRFTELIKQNVELQNLRFPTDALTGRQLTNVQFSDCAFAPSGFRPSELENVTFANCVFDRIELRDSSDFKKVYFENCEISCLQFGPDDVSYSPQRNLGLLEQRGAKIKLTHQLELEAHEPDEQAEILLNALRVFLRSTHVNENIFKQKLGVRANIFFSDVLPVLLKHEILEEVQYKGQSVQKRYKLNVAMSKIEGALKAQLHSLRNIVRYLGSE